MDPSGGAITATVAPPPPPPPSKKRKVAKEEEGDDDDEAEVEDALSHMMQMTLYTASKNVEPSKKGSANRQISPSNFKAPRAEVFSVMREEDESAHSLSGFVVSYGREMFVLPVSWLRKLNAYRGFAYGTRDVYSAFPLGEIARKMSDEHDRDLNESPTGSDEDAEFGADEIDATRKAFISGRTSGARGEEEEDEASSMCAGEGFIDFKRVLCQ